MALLNSISNSPQVYFTLSQNSSPPPPLTTTDERIYELAQQVISGEQKETRLALDVRYKVAAIPTCTLTLLENSTLAKDHKIELLIQPVEENYFELFLSDSQTSYLKPCDYNFAHLTFTRLEQDKSYAILHEFVAPNIGGKLALASVREVLKVLKIEHCYFQDGSHAQTKKCCKEGAPTSLKLLEVFKNGKGWYENQGAHLTAPFTSLNFETFYYLNELVFELIDPSIIPIEKMKGQYLGLLNQSLETTNHNYEKACTFLYELTFGQLKDIFNPYQNQEPYGEIYTILIEAQEATELEDSTRIGEGIRRLVQLDRLNPSKELHALRHRFLDNVVQCNLKQHFPYLQKNIETLPPGPLFFYSLAQALIETQEIIEGLDTDSFLKHALFEDTNCFESYLKKELEKKLPLLVSQGLADWKNSPTNILDLNCFKENYDEGLIKLIEHYYYGPSYFDHITYISKLYQTVKQLKISDIEDVFPGFSAELKGKVEKFSENYFDSSTTLSELLEPFKEDPETLDKASEFILHYLVNQEETSIDLSSVFNDKEKGFDAFFLAKIEILKHAPLEFSMEKSA